MGARARLYVASTHMLFLELVLIRWLGSNVIHLAYFSNFVLLGSFLGIGLGFLRTRRTRRDPVYAPFVLAALVVLVLNFPVQIDRSGSDLLYFTSLSPSGPPLWVALPVIFIAVAVVMTGSGELVGRPFGELPALRAYRIDLLGSLTGIGAFTLLSFLGAPPVVWGAVIVAGYLALLLRPGRRLTWIVALPAALVVTALAMESAAPFTSWSPYYKIELFDAGDSSVGISANGVPHQAAEAAATRVQREPFYALPYERSVDLRPDRVLVIGAGSGNDVAIALAQGAQHVDAVEIDPGIQRVGVEWHPDRPYDDPRVTVHIDDGRAFLQRSPGGYDLVLFALPDSLTLVSGASQLRLESYLFTEEAVRQARDLLNPDGAFAMYNYYREPWLVDRLAGTVAAAFGHEPCVDTFGQGLHAASIVTARDPAGQSCASAWSPTDPIVSPTSDNRPFVYLRDRSIPALYLVTLGAILLLSLLAVRGVSGSLRRMRPYTDLFLLGAGFLLLETKSVTTFALLFGTTWVVNAIVFAGVLVAVLAAVEVTRRWRVPAMPVMYAVLGASLLAAWLVPNSWLLTLPVPVRIVASVALAFAPVFAANVVFAKRLDTVPDPVTAFGANLLGAMLGGCLEYLALVTGYRNLLLVAGVLYVAAFGALRRLAPTRAVPAPVQD